MLRRSLLAFGCMGLLAAPALAEGQAQPTCCAKRDKGVEASTTTKPEKGEKMKCSLTGKVVDSCCCEQRDGKTYCTLAKKTVEKCCCSPAGAEDEQTT